MKLRLTSKPIVKILNRIQEIIFKLKFVNEPQITKQKCRQISSTGKFACLFEIRLKTQVLPYLSQNLLGRYSRDIEF
jgi:hypothetical protein